LAQAVWDSYRGGVLYMYVKHIKGQISETILTEYFLRYRFYVFRPLAGFGPIDIVVISSQTGNTYLLDAKATSKRKLKGRVGLQPIYRNLSKEQKLLGVRIAYVDIKTREVEIRPRIQEITDFKKMKNFRVD
jgi:outer membrane protein W